MRSLTVFHIFFFFNDTATTEIYTLSLHDALPIYSDRVSELAAAKWTSACFDNLFLARRTSVRCFASIRSEEHTSELQSRQYLVCRLLLEKKKQTSNFIQCTQLLCRSPARFSSIPI